MEEILLKYTRQGFQITFRPAPFDSINVEITFKSYSSNTEYKEFGLLSLEAFSHPVIVQKFFENAERRIVKTIQTTIPIHTC